MFEDTKGPIEKFTWARFIIDGKEHSAESGEGKDICVIGKDVSHWVNMGGHTLTPGSLDLIKGKGIDILIIGTGAVGVVKVSKEVKKRAGDLGIEELVIQRTPRACGTYNDLYSRGRKVCLLAHGTC